MMTTMEAASNPTRAPTPWTDDTNVLAESPKAAAEQITIIHEAKSGIGVITSWRGKKMGLRIMKIVWA